MDLLWPLEYGELKRYNETFIGSQGKNTPKLDGNSGRQQMNMEDSSMLFMHNSAFIAAHELSRT